MHTLLSRAATAAAACVVLVACTSAPSSAPIVPQSASGSPTPSAELPGPSPATAATASPTRAPLPASASLPVGRSAREIEEDVLLAPGPDGTLLVSIPTATGSVLALLDGEGMPLPGWPIAMRDSCNLLQLLDGGSVLVVCHTLRFEPPADVRAFAFEPGGHPRAAWPVQLGRGVPFTGRMVGDVLTLAVGDYDTVPTVSVLQVTPDGAIRRGTAAAHECCYGWTVAPDGTAYGSLSDPSSRQDSLITAVDSVGLQDGWPVLFDGRGSAPALAPDGRIVVAAGPFNGDSSRVVVFDRTGNGVAATSADLPLKVVWPIGAGDVDCGPAGRPQAPIIGNDGTIFVWSELDDAVLALDRSLAIRPGWPFEPSRPLQRRSYLDPRAELSCSSLAIPAVGPDGTLYLPLQARDETVGGSLVAVGSDGRVRRGWPVELKRPGGEFWSVVVGSDGTAHGARAGRHVLGDHPCDRPRQHRARRHDDHRPVDMSARWPSAPDRRRRRDRNQARAGRTRTAVRAQARPRASSTRPQWNTRTATSTPKAAMTRIAAAAIDASRSPPWNSP